MCRGIGAGMNLQMRFPLPPREWEREGRKKRRENETVGRSKTCLTSVAVLGSGKLENRHARVRIPRQAEGLGFDLVADVQILDGQEVPAALDPRADTNVHLCILTPLTRQDNRALT